MNKFGRERLTAVRFICELLAQQPCGFTIIHAEPHLDPRSTSPAPLLRPDAAQNGHAGSVQVSRKQCIVNPAMFHGDIAGLWSLHQTALTYCKTTLLMTTDDRTKLISRLLAFEAPAQGSSDAVADRAVWLWERLAHHLTPLIGQMGFESLYARAVHFSQSECRGLSGSTSGQETGFLQKLREDLLCLEYDIAERCVTVLLTKFIELVSAMIGEALTRHILQSAWDEYDAWCGSRGVSE